MRLISLGVIFHESFEVEDIVNAVESNFPNHLPTYRIFQPEGSDHIVVFWEKITIGDNMNLNEPATNITNTIPNCNVFLNELGDKPTFWKVWTPTIIGAIVGVAGIITSIIIYHMSNT